MKANILAGAFIAGLSLSATPVPAQQVSAEVVVRSGPLAGHVIVGDGYSTSRRPVRRVFMREHYLPRVIVVRYYDRFDPYYRGLREVIVYERDGRFYRDCDDNRGYGDRDQDADDGDD